MPIEHRTMALSTIWCRNWWEGNRSRQTSDVLSTSYSMSTYCQPSFVLWYGNPVFHQI